MPPDLPWGIASPLPMPVVRVVSRSRTASRTALESLHVAIFGEQNNHNWPIASFLVVACRGIRIFCGFKNVRQTHVKNSGTDIELLSRQREDGSDGRCRQLVWIGTKARQGHRREIV